MATTTNKKYYGYVVVALMAALMLPGSLIMSAASIFYTPVTEELGVSLAAFGMNLTIIQLMSAFGCPTLFTPLAKKFKMRTLLTLALIVEACCFAIRAMATNIWVFYITSVFITLPMSLLFNVCIPIVANTWFPKKTGTAIGVMGCTQGLGGMLFSAIGGSLIGSHGWRFCFWIWAAVCIVFVPFVLLLMRQSPDEVGQGNYPAVAMEKVSSDGKRVLPGMTKGEALKLPAFWICALVIALGAFAVNVHAYINPYCQSVGMSPAMAGLVSGLIQGGVFINKLLLGAICDKKGPKAGGLYYVLASFACFLIIYFSAGNAVLVALGCFLIGPMYAAGNLYGPVLMKYMFGPKDMSGIWAFGVLTMCTFGAVGGTIWGVLVKLVGYGGCFLLDIVFVGIVLALMLTAFAMRKNIVKKWHDVTSPADYE